jgi:hypothetical protein
MNYASVPSLSHLFPELETIYTDAIKQGNIVSGGLADSLAVTQAISTAIDRAASLPMPATELGNLVRHLVNDTILNLQKLVDAANQNCRTMSANLGASRRNEAKLAEELKLFRAQVDSVQALVPVRVVVAQDGMDTVLVEIEDEANKGLRVKRYKHASDGNGDFDAFKLWVHRDEIEEVL